MSPQWVLDRINELKKYGTAGKILSKRLLIAYQRGDIVPFLVAVDKSGHPQIRDLSNSKEWRDHNNTSSKRSTDNRGLQDKGLGNKGRTSDRIVDKKNRLRGAGTASKELKALDTVAFPNYQPDPPKISSPKITWNSTKAFSKVVKFFTPILKLLELRDIAKAIELFSEGKY
ncbi:MAG: hypothetical protein AB2697_21675 [Candidatus Thiodiazotropha endolucinida]